MIEESYQIHAAKYPAECTFSESDWNALANMWYPIALEEDIAEKPVALSLLDVRLVVARLGDEYVVAKDLCIHRGAPLSAGWIKNSCVVCPYHGYEFGADGKCTKVPCDPDWKIPAKVRLETYLHTVKYGLIWVCLSGDPQNQLPEWEPEADNPAYRRFHMGPEIWDCSAGRAIENFIDNAHFSFVHQSSFGQESSATMGTEYEFEMTDNWMTMEFEYLATNPSDSPISNEAELKRHMHRTLYFPFCTRTCISYPGGREHIIHINITPVSARKAQLIVVFTRNFDHDVPVEKLLEWERKILGEDRVIIEMQKPEEIPLEISAEVHAKADKASIAYRNWLRKVGLGRSFTA
ncbi:aromatic ring-hydroxylating oxygenase subunit alpha [Coraliomargarita parva]|uniref:aromatic ring-hydroxylating oxygenase subunit alpha n=1 Tax=Coraliomargarita parva TaxID=3014050 RepID=UPI0022B2BCCD|nr:aromatic ring-hydroxylating dioxygenase subunit alpha [Coraliomargarita parva]